MSYRHLFFATVWFGTLLVLPLSACEPSWDETRVPVVSDGVTVDDDTSHRPSLPATRVDLRAHPGLWHQVTSHGLSAPAFGLSADAGFETLRQVAGQGSATHTRARQTYRGVPIFGEHVITTRDRQGRVVRMHGNLIRGLDDAQLDVVPVLHARDVLADMKALHSASYGGKDMTFARESSELVIHVDDRGHPVLAYAVSFFADTVEGGEPARPTFLVDARSGAIVTAFDGLTTTEVGTGPGGNQKIGMYEYGTDYGYMDVGVDGDTHTMDSVNVKTVNLDHGTAGSAAYAYPGPRNTIKEINGAYSPLNDAHYFGRVIYDMYQAWIGVPPLTFQLTMRVHYSTGFENAFWDGAAMTFGDGAVIFYPLVSLDVSAHEVSHGFTEQNSGLIYANQSGGINEAFSDIAGEAAEYFMSGSNDWLVGAHIFKASGALRYMADPPLDGRSIGHASDYHPGMDVHYSSGVYNKAFYLLATTPGWNTQTAFQTFAHANRMYWTPGTDFRTGYAAVRDAATDLGLPVADVDAAFAAVGVTLPPTYTVIDQHSDQSGAAGTIAKYGPYDASSYTAIKFGIEGGSGDADLYVKFGSGPTPTTYDCRPFTTGNTELCEFDPSQPGDYYVMVRAYEAYAGVTLTVHAADGAAP